MSQATFLIFALVGGLANSELRRMATLKASMEPLFKLLMVCR